MHPAGDALLNLKPNNSITVRLALIVTMCKSPLILVDAEITVLQGAVGLVGAAPSPARVAVAEGFIQNDGGVVVGISHAGHI